MVNAPVFITFAKMKSASVVLSYPSIMIPDDPKTEDLLSLLHQYLSIYLIFTILDTPHSQEYQRSDMYISVYHLNRKSGELRTQKVLNSLCDVFPGICK